MKIIIDISKDIYEHAKEHIEDSNDEWYAMRAIAAGTQIQKGHGRLIDESCIKNFAMDIISAHVITDAPTIIEADTESEETKNV